jgi:starch-binding outer membrane protein, SusD/RagB family
VRSEARAEQGNLAGAAADLNLIRARAGLGPTSAVTEQDLLTALLHERQVELFTELGHRWLDLKRTGHVDSVMSVVTPLKGGGAWQSYQQLYPVAPGDIQSNPALTQNSGY